MIFVLFALIAVTQGASSACTAADGICANKKMYECVGGQYVSGKCPGADICCDSGLIKRTYKNPKWTKLPNFSKLEAAYPQGSTPEVKARIGGAINADWITNTCAIRMSHTLNVAGLPITYIKSNVIHGGGDFKKYWYCFRVAKLGPWLEEKVGPANIIYRPPGTATVSSPRDPTVAVKTIEDMKLKGIMRYTINGWSDASGHFDLWKEDHMVELTHKPSYQKRRYFSFAEQIEFWIPDQEQSP